MKTVLLFKEIYLEGFKNLGSWITQNLFKTFVWFVMTCYVVILYAFIYRMATGFAFD